MLTRGGKRTNDILLNDEGIIVLFFKKIHSTSTTKEILLFFINLTQLTMNHHNLLRKQKLQIFQKTIVPKNCPKFWMANFLSLLKKLIALKAKAKVIE